MDDTTTVKAKWEENTEYQKELLNLFDILENSPKKRSLLLIKRRQNPILFKYIKRKHWKSKQKKTNGGKNAHEEAPGAEKTIETNLCRIAVFLDVF